MHTIARVVVYLVCLLRNDSIKVDYTYVLKRQRTVCGALSQGDFSGLQYVVRLPVAEAHGDGCVPFQEERAQYRKTFSSTHTIFENIR